ncbi:undecaprenyl-diphosphate phosphatase [Piscirickettsia litoralis]|uniref:Undecaprenyl-diphosphatase n=1 Tax=Piscirickettsia litoralis TaxID=1891921 RepID=A0ABX2ZZ01_9GAMM|nr:undecaprenyl-diphosphate phosphatase [Piscirickettsia litoralis]ODN41743.1 undecaprenyl-diphosphatase [Piscirickettsia litoralis]
MIVTEWLILAVIQGVTEFLPISSSAHLIIPSEVLGWQDQGVVFDVAVHFGTLLAIIFYFSNDLKQLSQGCIIAMRDKSINSEARLVLAIIMATIPVALVGVLAHSLIEAYLRSAWVIAATTIGFGVLLWCSDAYAQSYVKQGKESPKLGWRVACWVGLAQVFALIPGTSRSGVTMTAGLFLGLSRDCAARFSFLLAIPVIILASLLQCYKLVTSAVSIDLAMLGIATFVAFISALLCIHLFLKWIQKIGFMPFVLYRFLLGFILIALLLTHG